MSESGPGGINVFEDFSGPEDPLALTVSTGTFGTIFRVVGETHADADTGIIILESDGLGGVAQLTSPNDSTNDSLCITTATMFDVGLMGPIVAEIRVRFADLDTKEFFFGFSNLNTDTHGIEGKVGHGGTTTITLSASDLVGFLFSSELTDDEDWHMIYNGGTLTGETDSRNVDANKDAVAGEFDVLRLQLDPNGDVTWTINGVQKQFKSGAVSTSTDLACQAIIELKDTGANETADLDYFLITANRDWTV